MESHFRIPGNKQISKIITLILGFVILLPIFLWIKKDHLHSMIISLIIYILLLVFIGNSNLLRFFKFIKSRQISLGNLWIIFWVLWSLFIGFWLTLNIPLPYPPIEFNPYMNRTIIRLLYLISSSIGLAFIFFILTTLIALFFPTITDIKPKSKTVWNTLLYSLPMIFVWSIYLLAFYPGMMSADSFDQWNQILTGVYVDHHPVFHTLILWLLTRIYLSPVVVAIAQIIFMALVAGLFFSFYESIGISKWVIWISLLIFSIIPVNGTMINTIWKDIPHGIAVLGLVYVFLRIIYSSGEWVKNWKNIIIYGAIMSVVSLMRHDGIVIGIGTFIIVFVFYPKLWKSWLFVFLFFFILLTGIKGPLYTSLKAQESKALEQSSLSLYELAAYSLPGSEPDQILKSMEIWPPNWNCSIWSKLDPEWKRNSLDKSQPKIDVLMNFTTRIPKILLYNYRCERSIEFIVWDPYGEVRNASHVVVLVDPNPFGIVADSKLPHLRDLISNFVIKTSHNPNLNWLFWRPAFFLYITIFTSSIIILRNRNYRFILIVTPALLQAITLTLIFAAPNFRYYYATYLVALITLPLMLSPKRKKETLLIIKNDQDWIKK